MILRGRGTPTAYEHNRDPERRGPDEGTPMVSTLRLVMRFIRASRPAPGVPTRPGWPGRGFPGEARRQHGYGRCRLCANL